MSLMLLSTHLQPGPAPIPVWLWPVLGGSLGLLLGAVLALLLWAWRQGRPFRGGAGEGPGWWWWAPTGLSALLLGLMVALFALVWQDRVTWRAAVSGEAAALQALRLTETPPPTLPRPTSTPTPVPSPASCGLVRQLNPTAADGEYTLYLGGDSRYPFTAYCHDMARNPATYLTLPATAPGSNFALISYPEGALTTSYTRIRLDPATLVVAVGDREFANLQAPVPGFALIPTADVALYPVPASDFGRAEGCSRGRSDAPSGAANIDLSGTQFVVAADVTFAAGGSDIQAPVIAISPDRRVVDLAVGGRCAQIAPVGPLRLAYVPDAALATPPPAQAP